VQERARGSLDHDLVAIAGDIQPIECLDGRVRLALRGAERREVVLADQRLRGAMHRVRIERQRQPPHAVAVQRRRRAARQNPIAVVSRHGAVARIEALRRQRTVDDGYRCRTQMKVHRLAHPERIPILGEVEVRNLPQRMDPRIGTPCAAHA